MHAASTSTAISPRPTGSAKPSATGNASPAATRAGIRVAPPTRFGRLRYDPIGVYPGSLGNYGGGQRKVPVVTIELPHAQDMPKDAEVDRIWRDMLNWVGRSVTAQKLADARP